MQNMNDNVNIIPVEYELLPQELHMNQNTFQELWEMRPTTTNKVEMFGKVLDAPRRYKVFGNTYIFRGMKEEADKDIPIIIQYYLDYINKRDAGYDSVLVNWYEGGNDYIGFHSDNMIHLIERSTIYGLSFGCERVMRFKNNENNKNVDFLLENNSVIAMKNNCQELFKHSIVKSKKVTGNRISLTFRKMKK